MASHLLSFLLLSGRTGCAGRNRTCDFRVMSPADYRLSYRASTFTYPRRESNSRQPACKSRGSSVELQGRSSGWHDSNVQPPGPKPGALHKLRHIPLGTDGGTRTPDGRFWRPLLYQLSYIRIEPVASRELAIFSLED